MSKPEIRFCHIRGTDNPSGREFTLAYRVAGDVVEFGYGFRSNSDHFCRRVGRSVATGRLINNPVRVPLTSFANAEVTYADMITAGVQFSPSAMRPYIRETKSVAV